MSAVTRAPLTFAMVIYPRMTLLDLVGPQAALGFHGETHLVWKSIEPVVSDTGIPVLPTTTFADCPRELDVLFVPGGFGTVDAMQDAELLAFLADRAQTARYVTSVCTGALILGAAGLLDGYKAATHWATYDALAALGVECAHGRYVVDRNRFTGGGVTAGLDFGLGLVAELLGETTAKVTQLMLEYNPAPPFDAGSPEGAGTEITSLVLNMLKNGGEGLETMIDVARRVRRNQHALRAPASA